MTARLAPTPMDAPDPIAGFDRARLRSIELLMAAIAHDLNNMWSPVGMTLELLAMRITDDSTRRILDTARECCDRGADLVRHARVLVREGLAGRQQVDAVELLTESAGIVGAAFRKTHRVLLTGFAGAAPTVGEPEELRQLALGVLLAVRASLPEGGEIRVGCSRSGDRLSLAVLGGVAPFDDELLAVAGRIAARHGGRLELDARPGTPTTVCVELELADVSIPEPACPGTAIDLPPPSVRTVLLVDDEPAVCRMARELLESHRYVVRTATSGEECLAIIEGERDAIDVVVTDVLMPGIGGLATIAALHRLDPDLPVVASSGAADPDVLDAAARLGVGATLAKPYSTQELLQSIARAVAAR